MALRSLNEEVSELCIGKPELKWITAKTLVADALRALKACGETCISVWMCSGDGTCECIGKICMADVILFLCRDKNLADPSTALQTPLYEILPKLSPTVRHAQPDCSVFKAIDYLLEGTQNLIIPIQNRHNNNTRKRFPNMKPSHSCHKPHQYCWLTQEHVLRFLLNSIRAFSPVYSFTIDSLNVIDRHIMTVTYNQPAHSALAYFDQAITEQKSVAVVDEENRLIGEISPLALAYSDETAASAIMALSAMDFMTYINCSSPPENLVSLVKTRLEEMKLGGMVDMMDESTHSSLLSSSCSSSSLSSCSSDDESVSIRRRGSRRHSRCEAVVCSRESSLLSVMLRAISHRVSCVWVVEEDYAVVGAVTCSGILNVFRGVACKAWMDDVF